MTATAKIARVVPPVAGRQFNVLGHMITLKLACADTANECYSFEVATPAGHGIPPHVHDREDEVIYVLEGEYSVFLGGEILAAPAGSIIYFPRHVAHGFTNVGATTGRTLWMVTPGANFEPFFNELAALPAGPPDLARVAAIFSSYGMEILPPPGNTAL